MAERSLPHAALEAVGPDGRLKLFSALVAMYLRPRESPALVRLSYKTRRAFDTLEQIAASFEIALLRSPRPRLIFSISSWNLPKPPASVGLTRSGIGSFFMVF